MQSILTNIRKVWNAPLTAATNARTRERVQVAFPLLSSCGHDGFLALANYIDAAPQRFYSRDSFRTYTDVLGRLLASDHSRLVEVLNAHCEDLDRAFLTLAEIVHDEWHDTAMVREEYAFMRLCDQKLHPAYLKLAEGVLHRLIVPIATCFRLDRGKSTNDLWKVSACTEELERGSCASLVRHCDSIVRNSIAHGRVTYKQNEVVYFDRNGQTRTLMDTDVVEMIDGLVDTCNGCALALRVFYLQHLSEQMHIPKQVMLEELQAETETPWWHIEGCLVSELAGKPQLVVYARPKSRDYFKVQYMCFYTAVFAEYFVPGFDRYMVSLRSSIAWPGWAAFDGGKLRSVKQNGGPRSMEDYRGALENDLCFYKPNVALPRALCRLETLVASFRLHMRLAMDQVRRDLGLLTIKARQAEMHRNAWGAVVNGSVVVAIPVGHDPRHVVRRARRRIVKAARQLACSKATWSNVARYLPVGYARIAVYQSDRRHRHLYGLDADLVCTVQVKFIPRIKAPDIAGSTIERLWPYRIAWNRAWLEKLPTTTSTVRLTRDGAMSG